MGFLNVGPWELVLVLIIAILVGGPKRTMEIARAIGRFSRQLQDLSREFTSAIQAEIDAVETEAGRAGLDLEQVGQEIEGVLSGAPPPEAGGAEDKEATAGSSAALGQGQAEDT